MYQVQGKLEPYFTYEYIHTTFLYSILRYFSQPRQLHQHVVHTAFCDLPKVNRDHWALDNYEEGKRERNEIWT